MSFDKIKMSINNQREDENEIKNLNLNSFQNLKEIESGVNHLVSYLEKTKSLRFQNEIETNNLKHKVNKSFEQIKLNLFNISAKINSKIDTQLSQNKINESLTSIENDIHILLDRLTSFTLMNDIEKTITLKNMNSYIRDIDSNLKLLESLKLEKSEDWKQEYKNADEFLNIKIKNMKKYIEGEDELISSMFKLELNDKQIEELSKKKIFDYDENYDYRKWLLNPIDLNKSNNSKTLVDFDKFFSQNNHINSSSRSNSFEFININDELDVIDVLNDFEGPEYKNWILKKENPNERNIINENENSSNLNEAKPKIFTDIYSIPTERWLLK